MNGNAWLLLEAFIVAVTTFVIGFILTFVLYMKWLEWRYPGNNTAQGDMGAFFLAIIIAPICSICCTTLSLYMGRSKYRS